MGEKSITPQKAIVALLEQRFKSNNICYIKLNGGLSVGTFGSPKIECTDDSLILKVPINPPSMWNRAKFHELHFIFGNVADPETIIYESIDKIVEVIKSLSTLVDYADNDTKHITMIKAPSRTAKSAIRKALIKLGLKDELNNIFIFTHNSITSIRVPGYEAKDLGTVLKSSSGFVISSVDGVVPLVDCISDAISEYLKKRNKLRG